MTQLITPSFDMPPPDSMISLSDLSFFREASRSSRQEYLSSLAAEFRPSDWHHLAAMFEKISCRMDILTALPLELSMKVLRFLAPVDTIRLRLVSKRYHDLLTSEETCSFLSHQFITPEYNSAKALPSWKLHYENHVSRRLSFASGKPWGVEILGLPDSIAFCPETFCLALTNFSDSVSVKDLNSYPARCVLPPTRTPDRSRIAHAALLPSFVVVATQMGHGYAWNLETHQGHQFKLPNSSIRDMHGSGNLVAIALEGSVIVHDVQAQKTVSFKDTRSDIRVWEEEEIRARPPCDGVIINPEKQVVWMISQIPRSDHWLLVIDSLHLETGGVAQRDICVIHHPITRFYSGKGLWLFLEPCACPTGRSNTQKRVALDQATGRLTMEYFPIEYPALCEVPASHRWGPAISSDGLGCFIGGPSGCVWMLNREPGDEVAHARPLARSAPPSGSCIWLCDKLALFDILLGVAVVRFKGIHDNYDGYKYSSPFCIRTTNSS